MITECKGKGADTLWRRVQARDWLRAHTYCRWDRGLRNATIPSSQFRLVYRRFIDDLGAEAADPMPRCSGRPSLARCRRRPAHGRSILNLCRSAPPALEGSHADPRR
jgi:hypothetical protein